VFYDDGTVVNEKWRNRDNDYNDVEEMSGSKTLGVQLAPLGWEDFIVM
jgi:hypothetical protein